jgi:hypothetical protein
MEVVKDIFSRMPLLLNLHPNLVEKRPKKESLDRLSNRSTVKSESIYKTETTLQSQMISSRQDTQFDGLS